MIEVAGLSSVHDMCLQSRPNIPFQLISMMLSCSLQMPNGTIFSLRAGPHPVGRHSHAAQSYRVHRTCLPIAPDIQCPVGRDEHGCLCPLRGLPNPLCLCAGHTVACPGSEVGLMKCRRRTGHCRHDPDLRMTAHERLLYCDHLNRFESECRHQ